MRFPSHRRRQIALPGLLVFLVALSSGCGDSSKVSGTQVEMSEEAKAQLNARRDMYREKSKQKAAQSKVRKAGGSGSGASARK